MSWLEDVERALAAWPVRRIAATPPLQRAAVLVPLFVHGGELWTLLTRRAPGLQHHGGAVVFAGGQARDDDEDEVATAVRETEEEIGVAREAILILGQLSDVVTASGFVVSPVVGAIPWPVPLRVAAAEVEELVPMPLAALFTPSLVEHVAENGVGGRVVAPVVHYGPRRIAGATAAVLLDLVHRLSDGRGSVAAEQPPA